jgi:predicted nucleic acid-binding protein
LILVDTSIWVDHLRKGDAHLAALLEGAAVLSHPFVIGELACGNLANRHEILRLLQNLPMAMLAEPDEVLGYIERRRLFAQGIGYVDAQLLAATALTQGALLWTRDKRLLAVAQRLACAYAPAAAR